MLFVQADFLELVQVSADAVRFLLFGCVVFHLNSLVFIDDGKSLVQMNGVNVRVMVASILRTESNKGGVTGRIAVAIIPFHTRDAISPMSASLSEPCLGSDDVDVSTYMFVIREWVVCRHECYYFSNTTIEPSGN